MKALELAPFNIRVNTVFILHSSHSNDKKIFKRQTIQEKYIG